MPTSNIVIFETITGSGGFNYFSADNTTFYIANLVIDANGQIYCGNSTSNLLINSSSIYLDGNPFAGGGGGGGGGPIGVDGQIAFNKLGTESGDANLNWYWRNATLGIGNSSVNVSINSTAFTGVSNNVLFVGATAAANVVSNAQLSSNLSAYQTTAGLSANILNLTANNVTYVGTVTAANVVSNAQLSANLGSFEATIIGDIPAVVALNTANNTLFVGTIAAANVVSNAQLSSNLASYQTSAALPIAVAGLIANNVTYVGAVTAANVVSNTQLSSNLASYQTTAGLSANVATLTSNNATNLGGQPASYYTNATNITTGTLSYGQLGAAVVNTSGNFTLAGNIIFSSNITTTKVLANGAVGTAGQALVSGGAGANAYWGVAGATGPIGTTTQIAFNNAGVESGDANLLWYIANGTLVVANGFLVGSNVYINTSAIFFGNNSVNSSVNSTVYSGTANNATNLGGTAAASYALTSALSSYQTTAGLSANVTTLTANDTLFVGTVSAANVVSNVQLTSNLSSYQTSAALPIAVAGLIANNTSFVGTISAANVVSNTQLSANLASYQTTAGLGANVNALAPVFAVSANVGANVGLTTTNITVQNTAAAYAGNVAINATTIFFGNTTVNSVINSTIYSGTANNATNLGGVVSTSYVNTSGNYTLAGNITHSANITLNTSTNQLVLEGGLGAGGNVIVNSTAIYIGNSTANATVNSTVYSGTANNATNLGGTAAGSYALTSALSSYQTTAGLSANVNALAPVFALTANVGANVGLSTTSIIVQNAATWEILELIATEMFIGNSTTSATVNSTALYVGNSTASATVNSSVYSGTANNATNLGGVVSTSYVNTSGNYTLAGNITFSANTIVQKTISANGGVGTSGQYLVSGGASGNAYWTSGTSSGPIGSTTQIAFNNAGTETGEANLTWTEATSTLAVNGTITTNNVTLTTQVSVNGAIGTAGQALLSGGAAGNAYWGSVGSGAPIGSTTQIAFNNAGTESGDANLTWTQGSTLLTVGSSATANVQINSISIDITSTTTVGNVSINTTALMIGNATVNATVNSTVYTGIANNTFNLGGTAAVNYANTTNTSATNITAGTLPYAQLGAAVVNTSGNFTLAGNITHSANITLNTGTNQLVLEGGLGAGGNVIVNSTAIYIGNSTASATVNSTVYSGTANNATNLGGTAAGSYALTSALASYQTTAGLSTAVNTLNPTFTTSMEVGAVANNVTANTTSLLLGNSSIFSIVNSTVFTQTANNATNFAGQGQSYYANVTSPIITTTLEVGAVGNNVTVNTTSINLGNGSVNSSVNSTVYSGTANNATNLGGTAAGSYALTSSLSSYQTVAGLSGAVSGLTANNTSNLGGLSAASYANASAPVITTTLEVGATGNNVTINTTAINIGNGSVNSSVNSTVYSGTANNATNLGGTASGSYALTSALASYQTTAGLSAAVNALSPTFAAGANVGANTLLTTTNITVQNTAAAYAGNVAINATTIFFGNSTVNSVINSTVYSGIANNSFTLGGVAAASYQTTAGLSANVNTLNPTFTTSMEVGAVANNVTANTTSILLGNSSIFSIVNSTVFTQTANNATNLGGLSAASYANVSAPVITTTLEVGAAGNNVTVNTTAINLGNGSVNSSVNSTVYTGTANNATYLNGTLGSSYALTSALSSYQTVAGLSGAVSGLTANNSTYLNGQLASYYTSATNITAGTLPWAQAPAGTANTSAIQTFAANITFGANATMTSATGQLVLEGGLGAGGNVIVNSTAIYIGNSTSNNTVNSTVYTGIANNSFTLGGVVAASYANTTNTSATNITAGTLPWAQAPTGTVNNSGAFTISGVYTHSANVILQSGLSANGGFGTSGQVLASNGTTGAPYWVTFTSGAVGTTTQIAFNNAGTESGDANLLWYTANGTLSVANGIIMGSNVAINTTSISIKGTIAANNGLVGTATQVLTSGGAGQNVYWAAGGGGGGPIGSNTQIAFNASGTESGDANLLWFTTNGTLSVGNGFLVGANVIVNTSVMFTGNSSIYRSSNSSTNVWLDPNGNTTINSTSITVGNTSAAGLFSIGNSTVNVAITSTTITAPANTGLSLGTSSIGASGYCWLPNGLMLNWGSTAASNSTGLAIVFSNAFPTAIFSITVTSILGATYVPYVTAPTTTGFTVKTSNATNTTTYYMAIGH